MKDIVKEMFKKENIIANIVALIACILFDFVCAVIVTRKN